jgi:uncharacterized protein
MVIAIFISMIYQGGMIMSQSMNQVNYWSGVLKFGSMEITIGLNVTQDASVYYATMDCIEQGMYDMPIDNIALQNGLLKFEIQKLMISYEGFLNHDKTECIGTFVQNGVSIPLTFKHGVKMWLNRPQEPKPPYPYHEEEVNYENKAAGVVLSGVLTLPQSPGRFPAVLLIAGSGRADRDEQILGHKPFLLIADYLTRQGIAVLRVDKRGVGKSTGDFTTATTRDFADDVLAGFEYLKTRSDIDVQKIGLIGHSEGGLIAPMVAVDSKDVAFIILLAAPGVTGKEILCEQGQLISRALGTSEETIARDHSVRQQLFSIIEQENDSEKAAMYMQEVAEKYLAELPEHEKTSERSPESVYNMVKSINSVWMRYFICYDPTIILKQITIPVLVLNGELDIQVPPQQNLPAIAKALQEAGNDKYIVRELPKLNHLFQTCKTGFVAEYTTIEETLSPIVLDVMSEWILQQTFVVV